MAAALLVLTGATAGQNSWMFEVEYSDQAGVINSLDDTATVTLWAVWDADQYAFAKVALNVTADEADKIFAALGEGGQVQMPLSETFFADKFGMLADKFGVSWMLLAAKPQA